jgi:hypothetical protein
VVDLVADLLAVDLLVADLPVVDPVVLPAAQAQGCPVVA